MYAHCPILGRSTEVVPTRFSRDSWQIVQCTETQFVFLKDPPEYEALESDLAWEVTYQAERQRRLESEPLVSRLSLLATNVKHRLFPNRNRFFSLAADYVSDYVPGNDPLRLMDIGCGSGHMLGELSRRFESLDRQVIPNGIEVSRQLAARANEYVSQFGGNVLQENAVAAAGMIDPGTIDLVIMSSFLEHECRPLELLCGLHDALADHGAIILKVPNFASFNRRIRGTRWCGFRFPDHVNYFTPATLCRLALEAGYICCQTIADTLPFSDNMYAVLRKVPRMDESLNVEQGDLRVA